MVRDESGRMVRGGAFMVFKVSNLAATLERLGRAGFAGFASPRTRLGYAMLTIRDPDGNQVELIDEIPLPAK
jgi:predicted enzyme related to lactoylglutathione lyase